MNVRTMRAHDPSPPTAGRRVLVERYWPRGMQRDEADIEWLLDLAPSPALIAWYGRKPERWDGFKLRYWQELSHPDRQPAITELRRLAETGSLILVYGSRDREHNAARALAEFLGATATDVRANRTRRRPVRLETRRLRSGWDASPNALFDWLGLFIALLAPLLTLLTVEVALVFGNMGWLVLIGILLAICGLVLARVLWRERHSVGEKPAFQAGDRESLAVGLVRISAYALGTILGLVALVVVLGLLALHAGLLF
jgi:uncharacterized protein YeaO (DUF488 family)